MEPHAPDVTHPPRVSQRRSQTNVFSDPVFMLSPEELLQMLNLTVCLA